MFCQTSGTSCVKAIFDKKFKKINRKKNCFLGIDVYQLSGSEAYKQSLVYASLALMKELVEKINETCLLGVIKNNKRLLINEVNANNDLQVKTKMDGDIDTTSSGRLLMSFMEAKEMNQLLQVIGLPDPAIRPGVKNMGNLSSVLNKTLAA